MVLKLREVLVSGLKNRIKQFESGEIEKELLEKHFKCNQTKDILDIFKLGKFYMLDESMILPMG